MALATLRTSSVRLDGAVARNTTSRSSGASGVLCQNATMISAYRAAPSSWLVSASDGVEVVGYGQRTDRTE
jgi:hypothetical protein